MIFCNEIVSCCPSKVHNTTPVNILKNHELCTSVHRKYGSINTSLTFSGAHFSPTSELSAGVGHRLCMCATRWLPPAGVTTQWALPLSCRVCNEGDLWRRRVALHQCVHGSRHIRTWPSYYGLDPSETDGRTSCYGSVSFPNFNLFSDIHLSTSGTAAAHDCT